MYPTAARNCAIRVANHYAVAKDGVALSQIGQGNLVRLGHRFSQFQTAWETTAGGQSAGVDHDGDVVARMHANIAGWEGSGHALYCCASLFIIAPGRAVRDRTSSWGLGAAGSFSVGWRRAPLASPSREETADLRLHPWSDLQFRSVASCMCFRCVPERDWAGQLNLKKTSI
jgi:hypothetical protein